jgi:hypothetical protein
MTERKLEPHETPRRIAFKQQVEEGRIINSIGKVPCANVDGISLTLVPGTSITSYKDLCAKLYVAGDRTKRAATIINFFTGDLLEQGEQMFGESAACVFGVDAMWSEEYVNLVRKISRSIPPELRDPQFSWHFYMRMSSAGCTHEEMRHYLALAGEYVKAGHTNHKHLTLEVINDDKVEKLLKDLPKDKQDSLRKQYRNENTTWRKVQKAIKDGTFELEHKPSISEAAIKIVDETPELCATGEIRDKAIGAMLQLVEMIKENKVVSNRKMPDRLKGWA